jgi:hypothetical protein
MKTSEQQEWDRQLKHTYREAFIKAGMNNDKILIAETLMECAGDIQKTRAYLASEGIECSDDQIISVSVAGKQIAEDLARQINS